MKKAIFWDFDGTLVYSDHLWSGSLLRLITAEAPQKGIVLDEVREHMKTGFTWHTPFDDHSQLKGEKWWDNILDRMKEICLLLGLDNVTAQMVADRMRAEITDIKNYHIYPDAVEMLLFAREKGYKNYILSNNYPELESVMEKLGLADFFDGFTVSAVLGVDKPRKEIFEHALKLSDYPECCFMVGDNPYADIEGANSVDIPSVLVHKDVKSNACYTFENLSDMKTIL